MKPPVELLTVSEVADLVRVSTMTVYRWVDDETLPSVKIGGTIRFHRSDIEAILAADGAA